MIKIIKVITGFLEENCYIIHNNKNALVIDPGDDYEKIKNELDKNNLDVIGILITHYHFDHIGALDELRSDYEYAKLIDFHSKGKISIKDFSFEIINNPGHTLDSVSYYFKEDKIMFCGDFIFEGSIGKYDYENEKLMVKSLIEFKKLDNDIKIYPGHGNFTTVLNEINNNPFLRGL